MTRENGKSSWEPRETVKLGEGPISAAQPFKRRARTHVTILEVLDGDALQAALRQRMLMGIYLRIVNERARLNRLRVP